MIEFEIFGITFNIGTIFDTGMDPIMPIKAFFEAIMSYLGTFLDKIIT